VAGIGFELKRLFARRGVIATLRAYGYAGIVTTGPMLLGISLLFGVILLAGFFNTPQQDRELLGAMMVYAIIASLTVTSFFGMITTRYTADMMYCGNCEAITPSIYGSLGIMLFFGGLLFGVFLAFAGIPLMYQVLSLLFFLVLVTVWTQISYLTAIKDYRGVMLAFVHSLGVSFLLAFSLLLLTGIDDIVILFFLCFGRIQPDGHALLFTFIHLLPRRLRSSLNFLRWARRYPSLIFVGAFINRRTVRAHGHYVDRCFIGSGSGAVLYGPQYDIAALAALLSILITSVNFVVSVEVRFYPYTAIISACLILAVRSMRSIRLNTP
jgi:uncharacterized membrane protein